MQFLKNMGEYAGVIISILTALGLLFKPVRNLIKTILKYLSKDKSTEEIKTMLLKLQSTMELHSEALMSASRITILNNYYKYMEKGEMKVYEKEALIREYEIYEKLGGNSFISSCYEELMELPTKK